MSHPHDDEMLYNFSGSGFLGVLHYYVTAGIRAPTPNSHDYKAVPINAS